MAKLIYVTNMSLDGYIEDASGSFDLGPVDDEVFASTTDLLRSVGTFLYGRRLYEMMAVWETDATLAAQSDLRADFATAWQAASKVVYSTTLAAVSTADTRLERHFDPTEVGALKARQEPRERLQAGTPTAGNYAVSRGSARAAACRRRFGEVASRLPMKLRLSILVLVLAAALAGATAASAGKTTVKKVPISTTVHAVLTPEGTPTGVFKGKVASGFTGCVPGATVTLSAPAAPGDESGLTEYSANRPVKPDGSWEIVLGDVGSPLVVQVAPLSVFKKVSKHKTIQCKTFKKSMPTPTS